MLSRILILPSVGVGGKLLKLIDQGWVEITGGPGFIKKSTRVSVGVDLLNTIGLKFYLFSFFTLVVIVFIVI